MDNAIKHYSISQPLLTPRKRTGQSIMIKVWLCLDQPSQEDWLTVVCLNLSSDSATQEPLPSYHVPVCDLVSSRLDELFNCLC